MTSQNPLITTASPLLWDVFCRVVDNFGDIGVCWRLACNLAERGQRVRLWVDDPAALRWMAPDGHVGVDVAPWLGGTSFPPPGDVIVEAFGCDPPPSFVVAMAASPDTAPVWINLEYLSAEGYVERSHGLASPQMSGPGQGLAKWFFYPGFTPATGGLLREPGLAAAQAAFDQTAWRAAHDLAPASADERLVSVFCYPGAPVERLVAALASDGTPTLIATAPGAATGAVRAAIAATSATGVLRQQALPWLPQADFDRLLWSCDLNFVRGEDSWVRAQWAGRPFVWQAYRQEDGAHAVKIDAFLALALSGAENGAAETIRRWTMVWNGLETTPVALPGWTPARLGEAGAAALSWRARLLESPDLVSRLLAFVREKR